MNRNSSEDQSTPGTSKRKNDDGGAQGRTKRNRYISIACNECKRRKIKCNGETPCQRCGNLSLECTYAPNCCNSGFKDSEEYRQLNAHVQSLQQHTQSLQQQLDNLHQQVYGGVNALQHKGDQAPVAMDNPFPQVSSSVGPLDPAIAYNNNPPPRQETAQKQDSAYSGPTSSAYFLDYANSSLHNIGITPSGYSSEEQALAQAPAPPKSPEINVCSVPEQTCSIAKDPLWCLSLEEVLRLCRVYADEMGLMYPILDINIIMEKAGTLHLFLRSMKRVGLMKDEAARGDSFTNPDTLILKLILAAAATVEGNGQSELGRRLFENVRRIMNVEDRLGKPTSVDQIRLSVVLAEYYFMQDEEVQAYRIIGLAARQCYELGLHRRDILIKVFQKQEDLKWAVRLFWVIYVLDRRWSFGTGLPFAMQDEDIDPNLPEPDVEVPYLVAMVTYGKLSSKVWTSVAGFDNTGLETKKDQIGYLDYQIQQWHNSIPPELRYLPTDNHMGLEQMDRGQRRLRLMLYLRANQLRIQLYRPVLYTVSSILESRGYAQTAIEIAKDSIRTLVDMNATSDIYRTQQVSFHYFLVSALAVLFLAVAHAPIEFSRNVREEFYLALDLIKGFTCKSYISKRLWKTIKGLKQAAPRLGIVINTSLPNTNDPHSSAAVAMAGLAGHAVDESMFANHNVSSTDSSPVSGQQMSAELTQLFETADGYGGYMATKTEDMMLNGMQIGGEAGVAQGMDSFSAMWGSDQEFVRVMKECF